MSQVGKSQKKQQQAGKSQKKQQQVGKSQKKPGIAYKIKRVLGFLVFLIVVLFIIYFIMKDRKEDTPTPQLES